MNLQLTLLTAYALGLVLFGLWLGRRFSGAASFFVGDRQLGAGLLFGTLLAANIGAGSTVGAAGRGYQDGWAAWWWVGSAGLGTLLLAFWIGPKIWRVAAQHDLRTVGDYLDLRFGPPVRLVVGVMLWFATLAIVAGQLIALAWVLDVVAGIDKAAGCIAGGVVITVYFCAGGLRSSAWVNAVQLLVMVAGFSLAVGYSLYDAGGWQGLAQAIPQNNDGSSSFFSSGGSSWTYMFLLIPAFMVSPGLLQKLYGARDELALRRGVGWSGVALLLFAAVPPLLGILARLHAPALDNPELALPTVLQSALPLGLAALGLAAIVSAELSSADAGLFMLSTSLSEDLYRGFIHRDASESQVLLVARGGAVVGGVLGVLLALQFQSVISALSLFYSVLSVSLFVPVVLGLNMRRGGTKEALIAIIGGVGMFFVARTLGWSGSWYNANLIAIACSVVLFLAAVAVASSGETKQSEYS